jgi:hypothetical protein
MDIKAILINSNQAITEGINEANVFLKGKTKMELPTRMELEFGINNEHVPARYDDIHIAKVRVSIPLHWLDEEKLPESPATNALQQGEKEKPTTKGKTKKDTKE